ncbi:RNA recognition motif domain-containing protein [Longitalea arenae]|uniref:RNA recognition motif domain-containing protein n=1 Tax=Longitalea arenae TaxID=2812558 RepID=UPI00196752B8|nr:RNA-binding protein [Longitalea arenae]
MRLFISNLNKFTTTSQIVALLLPFGLVKSAQLVINTKNGFSEGRAIVEMEFNAGQSAIEELNDFRFMNCFIKVERTSAALVS